MMSSVLGGTDDLARFRAPMPEAIFLASLLIWLP